MKIEHMGFNLKLTKYRGYYLTDTNRYDTDGTFEVDVYIQPPEGDVTVATFTGVEAFKECDYVLFVRAVKGHIRIDEENQRQEDYDYIINDLRTLSDGEIREDPHLWANVVNDLLQEEEGCNHDITELEKECLFLYCRCISAFKEDQA